MEQRCIKQGDLHKEELNAFDMEIRKEIIDFIGFDLRRLKEIKEELGLKDEELKGHLSILKNSILVEEEEELYRLTPRCIAYLDETIGYEWRR